MDFFTQLGEWLAPMAPVEMDPTLRGMIFTALWLPVGSMILGGS